MRVATPYKPLCYINIIILPGNNPWWVKITKKIYNIWQHTLLWPVIINKTIIQQNRIKL